MENNDSTALSICGKCSKEIETSSEVVSCDKCLSTFHGSCVKLNDNMKVWSCTKCERSGAESLVPPKIAKSQRSRKSSKCSSSNSAKAKLLMLEAIEEEKALLEKQAKEREKLLNETHERQMELVKKKQETIQELASTSSKSTRSSLKSVASITSADKVKQWMESNKLPDGTVLNQHSGATQTTEKNGNAAQPPLTKPIEALIEKPMKTPLQVEFEFPKGDVHSSTQVQDTHATYVANSTKPLVQKNSHLTESKRGLNREEIAARHVIKELPKFDGRPRHWPNFITSFNRSTALCGFNNSENLERLKQSLTGNAYAAVKSGLSMEDNVPRIIETLETLFGKPEFILNSLLEDLRKSSPPSYESIDSILMYSLEIENISMTMVNAKLSEHVWNPMLLSEIVDRLPMQLKMDWATYKYNHSPCSIEVFSMWLKQKAFTYASILTKPPSIHGSSKKEPKHSLNLHSEMKGQCLICSNNCISVAECKEFQDLSIQEKWNSIRRLQLCRICLKQHFGKRCKVESRCGVDGCEFRHNKILHNKKENEDKIVVEEQTESLNVHAGVTTYFKVLPVFLTNGSRKLMTYAMLDDGSSLTLLDESLVTALNLSGENRPLCLQWTKGMERRENESKVVSFKISQSPEGPAFTLNDVRTVENLCLPRQSLNAKFLSSKYNHLKDIKIQSFENIQPLLLIGLRHSKLMAVQKYKFGKDTEPSAAKTPLGWCIFGSSQASAEILLHIKQCDCDFSDVFDSRLDEVVRENYTLEAIGISSPSTIPQAKADQKALDILKKTVKMCGRRFETGLLWKYDQIELPDSLTMAKKRLKCLEKRMDSEPELRGVINSQIKDYLDKGYVKKLNIDDLKEKHVWYLPIFVVRNENKPNKIRLVWDAAAEVGGVSLNDVLLKGPDLMCSLPGVLLRFREHRTAICGDIKEMFHQILVRESDRRYQRFLWKSRNDGDIEAYEMCVMTFGACCSPSCAQYVRNINAERFRDEFPIAVGAITSNHYVDDWLQSVDTPHQAQELAQQVKYIHFEGGFEIHKWMSNIPEVIESMNGGSNIAEKSMELSPTFQIDKVLGMFWTTSTDSFQFVLKVNKSNEKILSGEKIPTKREFLRFLMSIFDPLGLITPVLIYPKILLQSIWRSKTDWDDEINREHHTKWLSWVKSLPNISSLCISRWVGLYTTGSNIEIHTFVDASEDAFAAAVYFKIIHEGNVKCCLITSKSRVAPLKSLSIPRLELQAAVLGIRLTKFVMENSSPVHIFSKRFFWTDSETVIKWLNSDSRKYTQYVACRIGEILENSKQSEWNWIPSKQNIADMSTKMRIFDKQQLSEWFYAPSFLHTNIYPSQELSEDICIEEIRPQVRSDYIAVHSSEEAEFRIEKWTKLRRTFAFIHRFIMNLYRAINGQQKMNGPLTSEEYQKSENSLIRKCQMEHFAEEYKQISSNKKILNKRSIIYKDSPFIDPNGILRAKGRIQSPYVRYDLKNPILLPRDHRITEMILLFYHHRYHHKYIATVANEIKQKFVVQRLKVKLKEIRRNCQECKNRDAQPQIPEEAPLPLARLTPFTRPFSYIGIDYFGPVQVVVGRKTAKRWCLLITCLTTRAIHLDVAHTLSTDSCILGLRRFMSRRGKPCEIHSDNGTNFKGAKRELREIWDHIDKNQVAETFIDSDTEWKFIPPASPHMGGAWERLVRTVKTSLKAAFPYRLPNDEILLTMLAEVENIINNRPLTYVELDDEYQEALTPNHFLLGSSSGVKPLGEFRDDSAYLKNNWHKTQRFSQVFWKRWVAEYLPTLNRRTKWFESPTGELKLDDIVIVLGEEVCGRWPKGKIIDVHRGKDGNVRSAVVQLESGIYTRPVSKLAKLDVRGQQDRGTLEEISSIPGGSVDAVQNENTDTHASHPVNNNPRTRSLRALPSRRN